MGRSRQQSLRVRTRGRRILIGLFLLAAIAATICYLVEDRQESLDAALIGAIKRGEPDSAIALLGQGANANAVEPRSQPTTIQEMATAIWERLRAGKSPAAQPPSALALLCNAAGEGDAVAYTASRPVDARLLRALLEQGAGQNDANRGDLRAALDATSSADDTGAMELLIAHGAPVNGIGSSRPPLIWAAYSSRSDVVTLLLRHGADVRWRWTAGTTSLHWAASAPQGSDPMIAQLLAAGADVDAKDSNGETPLMYAVEAGPRNVRLLLRHGANPAIRDRNGDTALDHARRTVSPNNKAIARLLIAAASRQARATDTAPR
jgi:ankyrin repeat protein